MKFKVGDHIKEVKWGGSGKIVDQRTLNGDPVYEILWHNHDIKGYFKKSQIDRNYEQDVHSQRNEVLNDILNTSTII